MKANFKSTLKSMGTAAARGSMAAVRRVQGFSNGVVGVQSPATIVRPMGAQFQSYATGYRHGQMVNRFFTRTLPRGLRVGWNYVKSFVYHVARRAGGFLVTQYRALAGKMAAAKKAIVANSKRNQAKRKEDWGQFKKQAQAAWAGAKRGAAKIVADPLGTATEARLKIKSAATGKRQRKIPVVSDVVTISYGATAGAAATYLLNAFGILGSDGREGDKE